MAGSQRSFCSSDPSMAIAFIARPEWTPWNVLIEPSPRASSIDTRPAARGLSPGRPWPVWVPPQTWSSARPGRRANGNSAFSQ